MSDAGVLLHQRTYLTAILERFEMANCSTVFSPMDVGILGTMMSPDEQINKSTVKWYQSIIIFLMYVMVETRPDSAYAVSILSHHCANPGPSRRTLILRIKE